MLLDKVFIYNNNNCYYYIVDVIYYMFGVYECLSNASWDHVARWQIFNLSTAYIWTARWQNKLQDRGIAGWTCELDICALYIMQFPNDQEISQITLIRYVVVLRVGIGSENWGTIFFILTNKSSYIFI